MRDENARRGRDRRNRSTAAVEDDDVGLERRGQASAFEDVRRERRAGHPASGPAATDRRNPSERSSLEMIRCSVSSRARERDEIVECRRRCDQLRLRRSATTHRNDDDLAVAGKQPRNVAGDGRLPDALAGSDHRDRRKLERVERRRVEAEIGADIRNAEREEARCEREPKLRRQHRLVGEVDDDLGGPRLLDDRDTVVRLPAQLLGAADEHDPDELVGQLVERLAHDLGIVLPVDNRDRLHRFDVTSPSIRAVYFSYVFVSVEN